MTLLIARSERRKNPSRGPTKSGPTKSPLLSIPAFSSGCDVFLPLAEKRELFRKRSDGLKGAEKRRAVVVQSVMLCRLRALQLF